MSSRPDGTLRFTHGAASRRRGNEPGWESRGGGGPPESADRLVAGPSLRIFPVSNYLTPFPPPAEMESASFENAT